MKTLNLLRPFRSSRASRGNDLEGNPAHANVHPAEKVSGDAEQQSASSPSTLPPPPYQSSPLASTATPVLLAQGWKIHHRGISWAMRQMYSGKCTCTIYADLLLGIEPPEGLTINNVVENDMIKESDLPFSAGKSTPLRVADCQPVGKWAVDMVTITKTTNGAFLKVEPKYHAADQGIYTIRIQLAKDYFYQISGRTRFTLHLEGFTARTDRSGSYWNSWTMNPWSDPIASARLDNDRTPALAAKALPWIKQ